MMRPCDTQCRACPFRRTSAPGWLGSYRPGDVFQALWHGVAFFCHSKINYSREGWERRAKKNGRLCLGGLVAARQWMCPTPTDPVIRAAREQAEAYATAHPDQVEIMGAREFMDHHAEQSYLERV